MFIRVSDRQKGMWGFGPIWLTFADKYPLELELDTLDDKVRGAVLTALERGAIEEVDEEGNSLKKQKILVTTTTPIVQAKEAPIVPQQDGMLRQKAKEFLEYGISTIRREIENVKNMQFLEIAIEFERTHKNRKTAIEICKKHLERLNAASKRPSYDELVVESEQQQISFKVEDMFMVHEPDKVVEVNLPQQSIQKVSEE